MRIFARRLITDERRSTQPAGLRPGFMVCDRLRPQLVTLMGGAGFRALLSRAVAVAGGEVAWLRDLQVKTDGTLALPEDLAAKISPKALAEGQVVLVAQVLELLVAFIGEKLTLQLVRESWPKLPLNDRSFGQGIKK